MPEPIADVLARLLASDDVIGILTRETDVRLVNISVSGCLLESAVRLEPGTTGCLTVVIDGRACEDTVRVTRVVPVYAGGSRWRVGVEFLWDVAARTGFAAADGQPVARGAGATCGGGGLRGRAA